MVLHDLKDGLELFLHSVVEWTPNMSWMGVATGIVAALRLANSGVEHLIQRLGNFAISVARRH